MKRILVCGGLEWSAALQQTIWGHLDKALAHYGAITVVQGEARGADRTARSWAESRGVPFESFPADWNRFGRAAGPIRNIQMLESGIDLVLAYPQGDRGTQHTIGEAAKRGVKTCIFTAKTTGM